MKTIADDALEDVGRLSMRIQGQPIGSTVNLAAEDYISEVFRQYGLSPAKRTVQFIQDLTEVLDDKDVSWSRPRK